jgi:Domain of unknown function (DUF4328)
MTQPYEPLADRGKAARIALGAVIGLGAANALSEVSEIRLLGRLIDGEVLSPSLLEASDSRAALLGGLQGLAYLAAAVLFIRWFHRAYRNLDALGSHRNHGTGWAIGGWFVPIMNLWVPYQVTTDILLAGEAPTAQRRGYLLIRAWWAGWVISIIGLRLIGLQDPDTVTGFQNHALVAVVLRFVAMATAVLAIVVVGRITGVDDRRRAALLAADDVDGLPVSV